jgi:hypothetical protein
MCAERKCLPILWKATPIASTGIPGSTVPAKLVFHLTHSAYNYYEGF